MRWSGRSRVPCNAFGVVDELALAQLRVGIIQARSAWAWLSFIADAFSLGVERNRPAKMYARAFDLYILCLASWTATGRRGMLTRAGRPSVVAGQHMNRLGTRFWNG
jgi:hypothetical protein